MALSSVYTVGTDQGPTTELRVRELGGADHSAWDAFVYRHPEATIFHSTGWMRAVECTFGYTPHYFLCERGGEIVGIAPVFGVRNWVTGHSLISLPWAVYGGICATTEAAEDALRQRLCALATELSVEYLELRYRTHVPIEGFHKKSLYYSFVCDLLPDHEANLKRLPRDTRYMIRKAEKNGLTVRNGLDQLPEFYRLFALSMRRFGTPLFPKTWFENLIREFEKKMDLLMVYSGNVPVSGVISFFFRDEVFPYYAGASADANRLAANNFMYWQVIRQAVDAGMRRYDFGRSKQGTGAYAFKTQWSMQVIPLEYQLYLVKRSTVPNFSQANPKFEMASRLWTKLPAPVSEWLGPRVVRWFP